MKKRLPRTVEGRFVPGVTYSLATQFRKGERVAPKTEIRRGQHLSRKTEFKRGGPAHNKLPVGTTRVRIEAYTHHRRAWIKIAEPNIWRKRAMLVWEAAHGKLPRGSVVHHRDRNSLNDKLGNLEALTRGEHANEHREEIEDARARSSYSRK